MWTWNNIYFFLKTTVQSLSWWNDYVPWLKLKRFLFAMTFIFVDSFVLLCLVYNKKLKTFQNNSVLVPFITKVIILGHANYHLRFFLCMHCKNLAFFCSLKWQNSGRWTLVENMQHNFVYFQFLIRDFIFDHLCS